LGGLIFKKFGRQKSRNFKVKNFWVDNKNLDNRKSKIFQGGSKNFSRRVNFDKI